MGTKHINTTKQRVKHAGYSAPSLRPPSENRGAKESTAGPQTCMKRESNTSPKGLLCLVKEYSTSWSVRSTFRYCQQ